MSDFVWRPSPDLVDNANVSRLMRRHGITDVDELVRRSAAEQEWFWNAVVEDLGIRFSRPFHTLRDTSRGIPWTDWFVGGELNLTANCLERHLDGPLADRLCLEAEHEDGSVRRFTFRELAELVDRCAAGLLAAGVERGECVGAYMPMTAEVAVQMFACFKIGAVFIPIFSGFAPAAVAERLGDAEAKLLFTADVSARRGKPLRIKPHADAAADATPSIRRVVVVRRGGDGPWNDDRDVDWKEFLEEGAPPATEAMPAMAPALILYTSGTTGRPKGTVHSHAGSLVQIAKEVGYAFDMKPEDRFFWVTDIGWMMGPWMLIGGLFHGATVLLYEGAIDWPEPSRFWRSVADREVTVLGISPTAVRLLRGAGDDTVERADLSRLRILGSTGEPWDEDSWRWFFRVVGDGRCPVINISGGTDIIGCFLSPLPLHPLKPCTLAAPGLGMAVDVWDEEGHPVREEVGYLVATQPAPSMTRGLWNDPKRYLESYWERWPDVWNHGDWAYVDADGHWFLRGRADDTLNVGGKRIGPAEIEGALIASGKVSEAAAIGAPHPVKGEAIVCFAVLGPGLEPSAELASELTAAVVEEVGKLGRPQEIFFVPDLPKTRSAKIVRRLVKACYLGVEELGDLSSIQNPESLATIPAAGSRLAEPGSGARRPVA